MQHYEKYVGSKTTFRFINEALGRQYRDAARKAAGMAAGECRANREREKARARAAAAGEQPPAEEEIEVEGAEGGGDEEEPLRMPRIYGLPGSSPNKTSCVPLPPPGGRCYTAPPRPSRPERCR